MNFLEVGSFGGDLAGLGIFFLVVGLIVLAVSGFIAFILMIMTMTNSGKKYDFKPALYGILAGLLIFIAGGCICGFQL